MTKELLQSLLYEGLRDTRIAGACFVGELRGETVLVDGDVDLEALAKWLLPRLPLESK